MRLPYKPVKSADTETLIRYLSLEGRRLLLLEPLHLSNNLIELIVGADKSEETGVKLF